VSADALDILAQLLRTEHRSFTVKIMNMSKQSGSVDCALYAMATLTHLAHGKDPTTVVFDQDEMRPDLLWKIIQSVISSLLKRRENQ